MIQPAHPKKEDKKILHEHQTQAQAIDLTLHNNQDVREDHT
jgi:hypothetical protein